LAIEALAVKPFYKEDVKSRIRRVAQAAKAATPVARGRAQNENERDCAIRTLVLGSQAPQRPNHSMREIVFDTVTIRPRSAERRPRVEIGCVELVNHFPTG
jgi:hypothetical protein